MILLSASGYPAVSIADLVGSPPLPARALRWRASRSTLRRLPPGAVILAEDECHLGLLPWVRAHSAAFVRLWE